jgi:glycosyltransferase involved in cell wall biosynthesis
MPVRNAAPFLDACVRSILTQTFADFEFVIFDDGSTDQSSAMLASWAAREARVRVVRSDVSLGLVGSSNAAVRASRAPIVARMDADDVAHPERLARQHAILAGDPGVVLVGTVFEGIDADGRTVRSPDRWRLLRPSPFAPFPHGSIMFRRDAFEATGGYDPRAEYWEDLDLFRRLAARGRVFVLPQALYRYRFHASNVRLADRPAEVERAVARMWRAVAPWHRAGGAGDDEAERDPRVLYSLAASRLWAGHDPHLWPRLRWRALASADPIVAGIFGVAAAASVSPRATRFALATIIAARDRLAGWRIGREPREWHFA